MSDELKWHMAEEHDVPTDMFFDSDFPCDICGKCCRSGSDLINHLKKHEETYQWVHHVLHPYATSIHLHNIDADIALNFYFSLESLCLYRLSFSTSKLLLKLFNDICFPLIFILKGAIQLLKTFNFFN